MREVSYEESGVFSKCPGRAKDQKNSRMVPLTRVLISVPDFRNFLYFIVWVCFLSGVQNVPLWEPISTFSVIPHIHMLDFQVGRPGESKFPSTR